jgi:plasmid stabilization system protein ParE
MDYVLVFRPEVRDELNDIYSWYESQQEQLGDEFLECIETALNRICLMPESYLVVHHDVRRVLVKRFPYSIYYRIISSRVIVVAVFHSQRNPKSWQDRN